ncbi:hemerythrin domain-containing protein [Yinghuangia sp. YIM S09857]|uniref:hemerythrin domain-containing protein n=1 Tax=Yinghuangia sp. YIM S09857 TaxID=3436929 RepID=UPI003F53C5F8
MPIDLTMMYAVHDAVRRDADRMTQDARPAALTAGWPPFKQYLTAHHAAEDASLWPVLRLRTAASDDARRTAALLDAMTAEHGDLDSAMAVVDNALAAGDHSTAHRAVRDLAPLVRAHLDHEERDVLPLLGEVLTEKEWAAFGKEQREGLGPGGPGDFLPWLLDDVSDERRRQVLGALPQPVRLLFTTVWAPRYRRTRHNPSAQ